MSVRLTTNVSRTESVRLTSSFWKKYTNRTGTCLLDYLQGALAFHLCCSKKLKPAAPEIRLCRSRCSTVAKPCWFSFLKMSVSHSFLCLRYFHSFCYDSTVPNVIVKKLYFLFHCANSAHFVGMLCLVFYHLSAVHFLNKLCLSK